MSSPAKPVAPRIRKSHMMRERKNTRHHNWFETLLYGTSIDNWESASATRGTKLNGHSQTRLLSLWLITLIPTVVCVVPGSPFTSVELYARNVANMYPEPVELSLLRVLLIM